MPLNERRRLQTLILRPIMPHKTLTAWPSKVISEKQVNRLRPINGAPFAESQMRGSGIIKVPGVLSVTYMPVAGSCSLELRECRNSLNMLTSALRGLSTGSSTETNRMVPKTIL